jgi:hypothetical protein
MVTMAKTPKAKRQDDLAPLEPVDGSYGPAMAALNDKQRLFVRGLFELPGGKHGAATRAARAAKYGTSTSSPASFASIASRLGADPRIQEAISEVSRQYVTTLGPLAVRALKNLLVTPSHREHGRALGLTMERVAPQQSTHTIAVRHDATPAFQNTAQVMARMAELAAKYCGPMAVLPAPIVIENDEAQPCK